VLYLKYDKRSLPKAFSYWRVKLYGLGFSYLKILYNTIREIAAENGKSYRIAIEEFFEWVEKLYGAR